MSETPSFEQLLTTQPGTIRFGGARMALLDVEAGFWALRRQLEALVGRRLANTVLQQAGANGGASFAHAFAPDAAPETAAAALRDCIAAYQVAGFGEFAVAELAWPLGRIVVRATNSFEVWAARQHAQPADQPVCAYSAGVLVGFVNALARRHDIVCIERACQAQGADACLFELLPAAEAGETAVVSFDPDPFLGNQLNLLELLFDRMPMGIAIIDRNYILRRFNPTWASFIGQYTPSPASRVAPGVSIFELEPGTEATLKALFAPVFAGETVRQEAVRLESGGIVSYWDVVLVPLYHDDEVVALLDVSLDATARVRDRETLLHALEALQQSEAHLRSMLDSARGYAVYRVAVDPADPYLGKVVLVSPSIRDVIGIADPYNFESWFTGVHPDDRARVMAANRRALAEGVPFDETMRFYDARRQAWRWVHTVSHP
ncbi:MAG: PAS domain-containing protein, partial [Anaerolineales bacterium]|nr:PAS domain-containing protein [Anaerolineales bacterium]